MDVDLAAPRTRHRKVGPRCNLALAVLCFTCASIDCARAGIVELRLQTPVTSYGSSNSRAFQAVVISAESGKVALPPRTIVYGVISGRRAVGLGFLHERAGLDLHFTSYRLPDGRVFPLEAKLLTLENAREFVEPNGHIQGILAANGPQGMIGSIWRASTPEFFERAFLSVTGSSGRIWSAYAMGPLGAAALFVFRCVAFRSPELEISLPAGTEFKIFANAVSPAAPLFDGSSSGEIAGEWKNWFEQQSFMVERVNGRSADDIINVGLIGSEEQLVAAFHRAGWVEAAPRDSHSLSRVWRAYSAQKGYTEAPTSRLLYRGGDPDHTFQKSLNTVAKRHHIRIWHAMNGTEDVWLGAATHDVNIKLEPGHMSFAHSIDPRMDRERSKVFSDLSFAGCAEPESLVERPAAVRERVGGKGAISDGRIGVAVLHACGDGESFWTEDSTPPHRSLLSKATLRVVLEFRQYVLRDNPYYWTYRALRWRSSRVSTTAEY